MPRAYGLVGCPHPCFQSPTAGGGDREERWGHFPGARLQPRRVSQVWPEPPSHPGLKDQPPHQAPCLPQNRRFCLGPKPLQLAPPHARLWILNSLNSLAKPLGRSLVGGNKPSSRHFQHLDAASPEVPAQLVRSQLGWPAAAGRARKAEAAAEARPSHRARARGASIPGPATPHAVASEESL